jgi:outer membrane autotransporter protein
VQTGTFSVAPYGGYSRLMMRSQAFQESGGISALTFGRDSRAIDQLRIGARARGDFALGSLTLSPRADVSLNRSWGDLDATRQARFATGRDDFDSVGSGFERQTFAVDAGVDLKAGPVTLSGSYRGRLGNRWRDHSALLSAALRF